MLFSFALAFSFVKIVDLRGHPINVENTRYPKIVYTFNVKTVYAEGDGGTKVAKLCPSSC